MKAIILAGGTGTRLRPLTEELPKPLVPFLGEPLLFRIIRQLQNTGIREITLTLGYRSEQIQEAVLNQDFGQDCHIHFSKEESPLGTAGGVMRCKEFVTENTLIISGDCVIETNLQDFVADFEQTHALASIAATSVQDPREFGTILIDADGYVQTFLEKPMWEQVRTDLVSTGIYLIKPEVIDIIAAIERKNCDFAKDVFPTMLDQNLPIRVFETKGFWCDIGSPESYLSACMALTPESAGETLLRGNHCQLSPQCTVMGSVLWNNVTVEEGTTVRESVLCDGVTVGRNVVIKNAFIGQGTVIEDGACVVQAKVDSHMTVSRGTAVTGIISKQNKNENQLRFPSGDAELVGNFTYSFLSRLCGAVAMFFEDSMSVAVVTDDNSRAMAIGAAVQAGLLACGRQVKMGTGISLPATRWMLRGGICDGGVFITENRIKLLNGHGNDLNRGERRRFHGIFARSQEPSPTKRFYKPETLQNPEEFYFTELMRRFRCAHRSLDYFGRTYTLETRAALIARVVLTFYPEAPIFISQHSGLLAEKLAGEKDRYVVRCGEKIGDMMEEMEKLMHIPGVYEQYLMFTDGLALDLGACMLREEKGDLESQEPDVYTYQKDFRCPHNHCAAAIRQLTASYGDSGDIGEDGLVFREEKGTVHVHVDGEKEALRLYVESFNEEYGADLLDKWQHVIQEVVK